MRDLAFETVVESLTVALEVGLAVVLTLLGVAAEFAGATRIAAGMEPPTVWYLAVGALALYAGADVLGYRTLWPRFQA